MDKILYKYVLSNRKKETGVWNSWQIRNLDLKAQVLSNNLLFSVLI